MTNITFISLVQSLIEYKSLTETKRRREEGEGEGQDEEENQGGEKKGK